MITKQNAIEIARKAVEGLVDIQPDGPITVDAKDDQFIVTFVHNNPPGVRGADYDAEVTINAESGDVVQVLGGS